MELYTNNKEEKRQQKTEPVRVLQVVTDMNRGGLETMLMNYYRHIDRSKLQFDFLTHRKEQAAYDDEIIALGGKLFHIPKLIPWSASYHRALDSFFAEHPEYQVIHVHQDCLSSVILKAAKRHGVPVRIAHSHSSNQDRDLKYPIKTFYMKSIPKYATHLFACGTAAGDWMFCGYPYQVLNNAVDAVQFSFCQEKAATIRKQLGIDSSTLIIGHVGRFWAVKNHTFLIDIFAEIIKSEPNARLILVGDGGRMDEIKKKVSASGLTEKVIFTGVRSDISDLMQAMDVFVLPSLYEGLPVTLIEAQAAGLPCVISDVVSDQSIITDLVSKKSLADSPEDWADTILEKRKVPRRNTLPEIVAAGFDVTQNAQWLQDFYLTQWKAIDQCRH